MNKITAIGYLGIKKCYLNISKEEAIRRYCESEEISLDEFDEVSGGRIHTVEFDDEFEAYDIWAK